MEFIETPKPVFDSVTNFESLETANDTYIRNIKVDNADIQRKSVIHSVRTIASLPYPTRTRIINRMPLKHRGFVRRNVDAVVNGYESFESYNGYENHVSFLKKITKAVKKSVTEPIKTTIKVTKAVNAKQIDLAKKGIAATKQAAKYVVKKALTAAEDATLLPLKPLQPIMVKLLKAHGVSTDGMNLAEIANAFYTRIVKGQKAANGYDDLPDVNISTYARDNWVQALIPLVIAIINWIVEIMKKKKEGKELSATEEEVANAAEAIQVAAKASKLPSTGYQTSIMGTLTNGFINMSNSTLFIIVGIIIFLLYTKNN